MWYISSFRLSWRYEIDVRLSSQQTLNLWITHLKTKRSSWSILYLLLDLRLPLLNRHEELLQEEKKGATVGWVRSRVQTEKGNTHTIRNSKRSNSSHKSRKLTLLLYSREVALKKIFQPWRQRSPCLRKGNPWKSRADRRLRMLSGAK